MNHITSGELYHSRRIISLPENHTIHRGGLSEFGVGYVDDFGGFLTGNDGEVEGVFNVVLATDNDALVGAETGTCGNEVSA